MMPFGDQGGFFEKPPPWTPRKTFYKENFKLSFSPL